MLQAGQVVRDKRTADVHFERSLPHSSVNVEEEIPQYIKDGGLVGDHLLEVGGRVLGLVGRVKEHLLHVVVSGSIQG